MTKARKLMFGVLVAILCVTLSVAAYLTFSGNKAIAEDIAEQISQQEYKAPTHVGTWEHGGSNDGAIALTATGGTLQGGTSKANAKHYYLNSNLAITGTNLIVSSGYVELCLNGYILTGKSGSPTITVNGGATLVIYDCCPGDVSEDGCRQQEHKHYYTIGDDGLYSFDSATVENSETYIVGGVVAGGGVEIYNSSTFIMNGGTIAGNEKSSGGGVGATLSTFEMNGGTIQGNTSARGGGVYVIDSTFTMNSGIICNNIASEWGGGVYATNSTGIVTMNGGTISGNTSPNAAGVVLVSCSFTMTDGTISDNTASSYCGGVYVQQGGTFTMEGGSISNNTANYAAGVCVYGDDCLFTMKGGVISGNKAITSIGGVYIVSGTFEVSDAPSILDNTVNGSNSNVYLPSGNTITITGELKDLDGNEAHIGVTVYSTGVFTNGYGKYNNANPSQYFTSDDDTKFVGLDFDEATIVSPTNHRHEDGTYFNEFNSTTTLSSGKYYLTQDFSGNLTISGKVELCLNGYAITGNGGKVITVNGSATFVLHDCCEGDNCETTEHKHTVSEVEISGGVITGGNTTSGGGVYASGTFVMNGGTIIGNAVTNMGGGVCVSGSSASFTMNGGTIQDNTAKYGGGVYIDKVTFIMNDGTIQGNTTDGNGGGGVYVAGGSFSLNGGVISGNTASTYGGGVYVGTNSTFTMNDGTIESNRANGSGGGGVYVYGIKFALNGGAIVNNWANSSSGGVHVYKTSAIELSGTPNISGNTIGANSTPVNLYLASGKTVTIIGALSDDAGNKAHIGVKLADGTGVVTQDYGVHNGVVEPMKYFFADNGKDIELQNGEAYLGSQSHEHSYTEEYINDEAEGKHYQVCTKCDYKNYTEHEWSSWSTIGEEEHQHSCDKCGATETANHAWDEGKITTDPSCTSTGVRTFTCNDCNETKEEVVDKVAHTSDNVWHHDADKHWNECSICHEQLNKSEHTWDEGDVTTDPSCTATGVRTYTCNGCDETKEEVVDKVAHTSDNVWHHDADNHWNECTTCDEKLNSAQHNWNDGVVTTEPTATDKGEKTFTCTECGKTKTEEIPATGTTDNPSNPGKPDNTTTPSNDENRIFLWLLILLLIVLIVDTAILIWQLVKRNKETEEGGNEQ